MSTAYRERGELYDLALHMLAYMAHAGMVQMVEPGAFVDALIAAAALQNDFYEDFLSPILDEAGVVDPLARQDYLALAIGLVGAAWPPAWARLSPRW